MNLDTELQWLGFVWSWNGKECVEVLGICIDIFGILSRYRDQDRLCVEWVKQGRVDNTMPENGSARGHGIVCPTSLIVATAQSGPSRKVGDSIRSRWWQHCVTTIRIVA
jgi:hypothetical protein